MGKKKKAIVTTVIRYLIILIFCVPMIMPLLWMLTTALKDNAAVFAMPPQWIPKVFHWENFTILETFWQHCIYFRDRMFRSGV